ncbi:MAG TPA: metal ABC transporter permease [Methanomassiliicoccales archaeon]|nr:metal ABC transporter permease [Methanomassiliicoccales archaeon]
MTSLQDLFWVFQCDFFIRAYLSGICAALLCAVLGVFIVLRRSSLIGEGIAHLSFGGIALGLFLSIYPLYTALLLSLVGTLAIYFLNRRKIVYSETAIGLIFSFGLAFGAVLASLAGGFSVDLFAYLFGSILTVSQNDLILFFALTVAVLAFVLLFYKELVYLTFDEQGARLSGIPVLKFEFAFNVMVALTVVVSIKIVGTLLISALLIAPAASSMQFSGSFRRTLLAAIVLGLFAVVVGLLLSFAVDVASGGAIVMLSMGIFVLSVAFKKYYVSRKASTIAAATCDYPDDDLVPGAREEGANATTTRRCHRALFFAELTPGSPDAFFVYRRF